MHSLNGSISSALALCDLLLPDIAIQAWTLPVQTQIDDRVLKRFSDRGIAVNTTHKFDEMPADAHLFFQMGEYPIVFGKDADVWRDVFERAHSVQFSINFNIGALPNYPWLANHLSGVYFQNTEAAGLWQRKAATTRLEKVPIIILPPPVDLDPFLGLETDLDENGAEKIVIGLLSGSVRLAMGVVDFYTSLAKRLPQAEFWFMPTPDIIRRHFSEHPGFRLFDRDELPIAEFIQAMDIYCLPSNPNAQTLQGTRTLVEVMAAAGACVFVDRLGPRDRIVHGESGFKTNSLEEMQDYVVRLANNEELRASIGLNARERAQGWRVLDWRDAILEHIV